MRTVCYSRMWCSKVHIMLSGMLFLFFTDMGRVESAKDGGDERLRRAAADDGPGLISYHMLEELARGSRIGSVATDARLDERYTLQERQKLRFSFLEQPGVDTKLFAIDDVTGIITTAARIDRDQLCPQQPRCEVFLDVAVGPAQFFQVIHTRIEILDVNDNRPRFPQRVIELQIPESALTGTGFSLPLAVDRDSDMNGVQKYELVHGARKFDLAEDITAGEVTDLKLVLIGELDREKTDFYQLRLIAHDGGTSPRSGVATINITVLDANDNDPVFLNKSYEVRVPEDQSLNTTLARLKAIDADLGKNAHLTYSLSSRSTSNYGETFAINPHTGDLSLRGPLDYERVKRYNLIVTVRDGGAGAPHVDQCTVTVDVLDVNDNAPQVTVNTLTSSGDAQISELCAVDTFVAHISAVDRDSGRNGELSCSLDSSLFRLVLLNRNQYKIVTAGPLDREVRSNYMLALSCSDLGRPPQTTTMLIKVRVLDENDHVPVFEQDSYAVAIEENNPIGMFLLRLNATDKDAGANARIRYTMEPARNDLFTLDPDTGVLKTATSFDHERVQQLEVRVVASDHGEPPLSTSTTLLVRIIDENDEKPQFTKEKYSFGVVENRPINSEVGRVAARDADLEPFNRITFAFDARDAASGVFEINPTTGLITTRQSLDREKQSAYHLRVLAYNPGYPSTTSVAALAVHVSDENDNAPVLDRPQNGNATVSISNHVPVGYTVYRVRAHDIDIGTNAKLSYRIVGGNKGGLFAVTSTTGAVTTTRDLSTIEHHREVLRVQVRDGGEPARTSSGFLTVLVNSSIIYRRPSDLHVEPPRPANNMIIVLVLSAASGLVLLVLIIVLICIKLQTVQRRRHTYKCRPEAQRMLRAIDGKEEHSPMSNIYLPPASAAGVKCKEVGRRVQAEGSSTQNVHGCVAMEEGLQKMASEQYMSNMRYSRPPGKNGPTESHQHLGVIRAGDTESACSVDGSNPDSGHGASDQGQHDVDKGESDSHSDGHQRSSVSSTESAKPNVTLANTSVLRSANGQPSTAGQYPVLVSRGPDIRPHVYTELKTFSPVIYGRPTGQAGRPEAAGAAVKASTTGASTCVASLPRYRRPPASGARTTTTFGSHADGTRTITTFGKLRPRCPDGRESSGHGAGSPPPPVDVIEPGAHGKLTLECRPHAVRAANLRVPEPPVAPPVRETIIDADEDDEEGEDHRDAPTPTRENRSQVKNHSERGPNECDTSRDSGVVDAQGLPIDDTFFKGMLVKQKTIV